MSKKMVYLNYYHQTFQAIWFSANAVWIKKRDSIVSTTYWRSIEGLTFHFRFYQWPVNSKQKHRRTHWTTATCFEWQQHFGLKSMLICVYSVQINCHFSDMKLTRQEYYLSLKSLLLYKTFLNKNHSDSFDDLLDLSTIIDDFCHCVRFCLSCKTDYSETLKSKKCQTLTSKSCFGHISWN